MFLYACHTGTINILNHTQITTPNHKRRKKQATYKSSSGSRLLLQVRWTSQQDAFSPSRDNQMGWTGKADNTMIVHQKLHRSQQHLPTTHPHAVSQSAHMLHHTKDASENLTYTFSGRSTGTAILPGHFQGPGTHETHTCMYG